MCRMCFCQSPSQWYLREIVLGDSSESSVSLLAFAVIAAGRDSSAVFHGDWKADDIWTHDQGRQGEQKHRTVQHIQPKHQFSKTIENPLTLEAMFTRLCGMLKNSLLPNDCRTIT